MIMRYTYSQIYFSKMGLVVLFSVFCTLFASNLFAADFSEDSNDAPLSFAFSISPVSAPVHLKPFFEDTDTLESSFATPGLMVNSTVASMGLKGGLSFFSGEGSPTAAPDNFSAVYSFNGWSNSENILVYPNGGAALSATEVLAQDHINKLQAVSLYGGYDITPSVKIKGAFLISKTQATNKLIKSSALTNNSSYSWWLDFAGDYKLSDKMTYTVNFGYYDSDAIVNDSGGGDMLQGSVYLFNNQLNMSF